MERLAGNSRKEKLNIIRELLRRCLEVACFSAGLQWCTDREILYFPELGGPQHSVSFKTPDGTKTRVNVTGLRQFGYGDRAQPYHYQLAGVSRRNRHKKNGGSRLESMFASRKRMVRR